MTTLTLPRLRKAVLGSQIACALIDVPGHVVGWAQKRSRALPGLAGAALASWSVAQIYMPAGGILGGVFLLAMDRQIKLGPSRQE